MLHDQEEHEYAAMQPQYRGCCARCHVALSCPHACAAEAARSGMRMQQPDSLDSTTMLLRLPASAAWACL